MDAVDVTITVLVALGAFVLWLLGTALWIWGERRLIAPLQSRIGPNRLGPFGILQSIADGAKMFFKEDIRPSNIDTLTYFVAPVASASVALLTFAVIPYGGSFTVAGREVTLQVWDPEFGLLWILAMSSIGVYGIVLAGWSSGSKYPLLGGVRSTAQMISYELAMGLSLAAVFIWSDSLRSSEIVAAQAGTFWGPIPAWNVAPMSVAFVIFFITAIAETQRPPFDMPEAEGELVAGFMTEYSGAKFAMFMLAEFMNTITLSAVMVTLFFGGPSGPLFGPAVLQAILPTVYFVLKVFVLQFCFMWLRATLPRTRYDRLMDLGWKVLLPLGLLWVMVTAGVVLYQQDAAAGGGAATARTVLLGAGAVLLVALASQLFAPRPPPGGKEATAAAVGDTGASGERPQVAVGSPGPIGTDQTDHDSGA